MSCLINTFSFMSLPMSPGYGDQTIVFVSLDFLKLPGFGDETLTLITLVSFEGGLIAK